MKRQDFDDGTYCITDDDGTMRFYDPNAPKPLPPLENCELRMGSTGKPLWPCRRLVLTFTHQTAGDSRFNPMVRAAFAEWLKALDEQPEAFTKEFWEATNILSDTEPFTASNGVTITPSGYETDYE